MAEFNLQSIMEGRYWFYQFFSYSFLEIPKRSTLELYWNKDFLACLGERSASGALLVQSMELMRSYTAEDWKQLAKEHVRLFDNAGPMVVYPWESVYLSREHIINDEHTLAVKEFYQSQGVAMIAPGNGPVDHVGIECAFMAKLLEQALVVGDDQPLLAAAEVQRQFLVEHLLKYVDEFCGLLEAASEYGFYKGLAGFFNEYIHEDANALSLFFGEDGTMAMKEDL